jgi:hypothetical protein
MSCMQLVEAVCENNMFTSPNLKLGSFGGLTEKLFQPNAVETSVRKNEFDRSALWCPKQVETNWCAQSSVVRLFLVSILSVYNRLMPSKFNWEFCWCSVAFVKAANN